ncbi:MAG: YtxH domain-containing protein [Candidatus Magnetoovum sp. WYHC-5]|nr:YtxH domain-containing protein [Candidatus Magnetoovum sp. WYHC-5]
MNPKQKLSGAIVFASVFFGSFLGAGITLLTSPKSARDLKNKVAGAVDILKENLTEKMDNVTVRVIENSTKVTRFINVTKENKNKYIPRIRSIKEEIKATIIKKKRLILLSS